MATNYVTEENLQNILDGIEQKIGVTVNNNVNRVKVSILSSSVTIYTYGGSTHTTVTLEDDPSKYDGLEFDMKFTRTSGTVYCETFYVSKESFERATSLRDGGTGAVVTTINSVGGEDIVSNKLSYFFRATIIHESAAPKNIEFVSSVGGSDQAASATIEVVDVRGITYTQSYGDTPIGTIISYMGITPPDEYLSCDGTSYNIADYWELAEFIKSQFGSYNYFGGDGSTTFAVPDLRGEFLRGTGTNSHSNQGSGTTVGTHQDATLLPNMRVDSSPNAVLPRNGTGFVVRNADTNLNGSSVYGGRIWTKFSNNDTETTEKLMVTSRPTNTSILYCIKYTNSPSMQPSNTYSTTEKRIGTWLDGKPIYQKTYTVTTPSTADAPMSLGISFADVDKIIDISGWATTNDINMMNVNNYSDPTRYIATLVASNRLLHMIVGSLWVNATAYLTVQYTK